MSKKTIKQTSLENQTANLISTTEAARISGLTTGYIRRLLIRGDFEGIKVGRNWLLRESTIREFMKQKRRPGPKASRE